MIKRLLLLAAGLSATALSAQNIVTTVPQRSAVVLEEYTGIKCVYCPDGHKRAKELKADYPGKVVVVNIHQGGYASPSAGQPDFRTSFGDALAAQINLTGYPTGTINRDIFPNLSSSMAMSRTNWRTAAGEVMERNAAVNLGASSSYDPITRTLSVSVEALYTDDAVNSYNLLNIALLQDSVLGPQTGGSSYNPGDMMNGQYVHGHMLRHLITGQWGDTIATTQKGDLFSKTFSYVLPDSINDVPLVAKDCHLAIYLAEGKSEITQGISLGLDDSNDGNHSPVYGTVANMGNTIIDGTVASPSSFSFDFNSNLPNNTDFKVSLSSGAPADWSASFEVNATSYNGSAVASMSANTPNNLKVIITPGNTAALGKFTLSMAPLSDTSATLEQEFYVASGVTDLVVNGSGGFGDGNSYQWDGLYTGGLQAAGNTSYDLTTADVLEQALDQGALSAVKNLYLNIAWTFPSLSDGQALALMDFMDQGGNVMIAGQDIGWDIKSGSGNGTAITGLFYSNYLNASYIADGSTNNTTLSADTTDNIYGAVAGSSLSQAYGNNFYPDELAPINKGQAIFNYNGGSKIAGVRAYDGYKSVYLGVGLEMIADASVQQHIMEQTMLWFNGTISVAEYDLRMQGFSVYPNPGKGRFQLEMPLQGDYSLAVRDAAGQLMLTKSFSENELERSVDLGDLPAGLYLFSLSSGETTISQKVNLQ